MRKTEFIHYEINKKTKKIRSRIIAKDIMLYIAVGIKRSFEKKKKIKNRTLTLKDRSTRFHAYHYNNSSFTFTE